jgi:hypothetical protein
MDAERKAKLGARWSCYSCGAKFYDLGKADPLCPRCQADQRQSPKFEQPKAKRARPAKKAPARPAPEPRPPVIIEAEGEGELDFDDVELIAPEGMGLDTAEDDEPGAEAAEEIEVE